MAICGMEMWVWMWRLMNQICTIRVRDMHTTSVSALSTLLEAH